MALVVIAFAAPTVAQPGNTRLAEIPEGIRVGPDLIPTTNLGAFVRRSAIAWSADGTRVAYAGVRGSESGYRSSARWSATRTTPCRVPSSPAAARSSKSRPRPTPSEQKHWVWAGGDTLPVEDWIGRIGVSPAGDRVAY